MVGVVGPPPPTPYKIMVLDIITEIADINSVFSLVILPNPMASSWGALIRPSEDALWSQLRDHEQDLDWDW